MRTLPYIIIYVLVLAGCDSEPAFFYPRDGALRLDQVQLKGTHNSYHVAPDPPLLPELAYTHAPLDVQLEDQGVRQLELDVYYVRDDTGPRFEVHHLPYDRGTRCELLGECLATLRTWSDAHPAHGPLVVAIELKDNFDPGLAPLLIADLESALLAAWPRERLITPGWVQGSRLTLREAIVERGWPVLAALRGKVLFVLLAGDYEDTYTHGGVRLDDRLAFVFSDPSRPYAALANVDDPIAGAAAIDEALGAGLLVRTRADDGGVEARANDTMRLTAALASGAELVATDYPAPVAGLAYVVDLPGGAPSRCNPRTAPAWCQATDVEDPAFLP